MSRLPCCRRRVLQVSEKIVLLDDEVRKLRAHEAESEARAEQLQADKKALLSTNEALRSEVSGIGGSERLGGWGRLHRKRWRSSERWGRDCGDDGARGCGWGRCGGW